MSNIDRAGEVIATAMEEVAHGYPSMPGVIAQALADAGLLAPDLPEPTDRSIPEWEMPNNEHHAVSVSRYGTVRIWGDTSGYEPAEARALAAALLSAAAWAEQQ